LEHCEELRHYFRIINNRLIPLNETVSGFGTKDGDILKIMAVPDTVCLNETVMLTATINRASDADTTVKITTPSGVFDDAIIIKKGDTSASKESKKLFASGKFPFKAKAGGKKSEIVVTSVRVKFTDVDRIQLGLPRNILVEIQPNVNLNLKLERIGGSGTAGEATFLDGESTMIINKTQNVFVKGVEATTPLLTKNIRLFIKLNNTICRETKFEVFDCTNIINDDMFILTNVKNILKNGKPREVKDAVGVTLLNIGTEEFAIKIFGSKKIKYFPHVKIDAGDADATDYTVGFSQVVLSAESIARYENGVEIVTTIPILPIKDGLAGKEDFDELYAAKVGVKHKFGAWAEAFTKDMDKKNLIYFDAPGTQFYFFNLDQDPLFFRIKRDVESSTLVNIKHKVKFRTWVVARHEDSTCIVKKHHVDWELDWEAEVDADGDVELADDKDKITITAVGDGSPSIIRGAPVANEAFVRNIFKP